MSTGPNPPNRPPDTVTVVRRLVYDGTSLSENLHDMYAGSDDEVIELTDVINLSIDYALEDINNPALNFEIIAVWRDEHGNETHAVVYDNNGNPFEWTVSNEG